ncbi:MAG: hypothetical protein HY695_28510 [Deltaproteobacteria bacterium]|nr:hypothetical protein [Deltaproteobacteria bacterium]
MSYSFSTYSGGTILFDYAACLQCETKACIPACNPRGSGSILELRDGTPVLKISAEAARKGQCSECLACEEACRIDGKGALRIELPIPALNTALEDMAAKGLRPVYWEG